MDALFEWVKSVFRSFYNFFEYGVFDDFKIPGKPDIVKNPKTKEDIKHNYIAKHYDELVTKGIKDYEKTQHARQFYEKNITDNGSCKGYDGQFYDYNVTGGHPYCLMKNGIKIDLPVDGKGVTGSFKGGWRTISSDFNDHKWMIFLVIAIPFFGFVIYNKITEIPN